MNDDPITDRDGWMEAVWFVVFYAQNSRRRPTLTQGKLKWGVYNKHSMYVEDQQQHIHSSCCVVVFEQIPNNKQQQTKKKKKTKPTNKCHHGEEEED